MQLDQLLAATTVNTSSSSYSIVYLDGVVEADHDPDYFRLYRDPANRRSYMLVLKADVKGELYEWTSDELVGAGQIGASLFRVPISHGALVQVVTINIHRLGETISGTVNRGHKLMTGECHYANGGCSPDKCCSTGEDGECYCDSCCVA